MRNRSARLSFFIPAGLLLLMGAQAARAQQPGRDVTPIEQFYVIGEVAVPSAIPFKTSITISEAIALAGGILPDGGRERALIIRQREGDKTRTVVVVALKAKTKHQADDVLLQPYDIVEILAREASKHRKKECPHTPCYKIEPMRNMRIIQ